MSHLHPFSHRFMAFLFSRCSVTHCPYHHAARSAIRSRKTGLSLPPTLLLPPCFPLADLSESQLTREPRNNGLQASRLMVHRGEFRSLRVELSICGRYLPQPTNSSPCFPPYPLDYSHHCTQRHFSKMKIRCHSSARIEKNKTNPICSLFHWIKAKMLTDGYK